MTSLSVRAGALLSPGGDGPLRGDDLREVESSSDTAVVCDGDRIADLGGGEGTDAELDASDCLVIPGFVDPHTHLPFFGWRADEDAARLSGVRYESIHAGEGGIFRSQRMLAEASDEEVLGFCKAQAASMLRHGTTTFETKTGYGLSVAGELRQAELARTLAGVVPQTVVSTCLSAHAVPTGKMQGEWIGEVAQDILPEASSRGWVVAADIYVESIAFALEHAARLSEAASSLGLAMRVHADQLADNQTGSFAARWGFRSADHLNHTSLDGVDDLAGSGTAAVLLPAATFTLRQSKKPPAEDLIKAGAIVALGSDFNPGTSPVHSMPFVIALAARLYGLRPRDAFAAATVNAAYVLGLQDEVGRLRRGMRADMVVLEAPTLDDLTYRPDHDPVVAVVCGGEVVHIRPSDQGRLRR